jgi:squalene-hopene/tetraprenyl-beta-curcumene cyclase
MDRMRRSQPTQEFDDAIVRAREWIEGLASRNGGWAAFDADNTHYYLNNIPFADHGALLDPPTEDVTARCVSTLAQLGAKAAANPLLRAAIDYLRDTQRDDGSWYGRWGINYIYGTWSVLCALNAAGFAPACDQMRAAADWLVAIQNPDGGWGEDGTSYQAGVRTVVKIVIDARPMDRAAGQELAKGFLLHPDAVLHRQQLRYRLVVDD